MIRTKRIAALSITGLFAGLTIVLIHDGWTAHADSSSQLTLPSATGINIALTGGPHKWAGCQIVKNVLQPDCLYHDYPWNSVDLAPADGRVYASHGGIAHLGDCPLVNSHRSFVRIDFNDGSGFQVSYEHIHDVDLQITEGQSVTRGQYLGNISTDSNCGAYATGAHTHMSLWHFTSGTFTKAGSQAVDLNAIQIGAWLLDDGSPTQEQYTGCMTPVAGGTRLCPTVYINNDGSVGTPCTAVTASASPTSPQAAGTQVTITATSTCPSASPLYKFWMFVQGSSPPLLLQDYSTSNVYHWNSTGAAAGTETIGVWVLDAKSVGGGGCNANQGCYDAFTALYYTVQVVPCTGASISASPRSPSFSGTTVAFTGVATGCPNPSYEFWMLAQGSSTWQQVQAYSIYPSYVWDSTGALQGTEHFKVNVRDASSSASYDAFASMAYAINTGSCASVSISASPTTVVHSNSNGQHVIATAVASSCTTYPLYQFLIRPASQNTWQVVQTYSTTATYDWNSTGAAVGTVYIGVWVKDSASPNSYDAVNSTPVSVT